ncbi:MAG: helix-turn-helix domain-containing protein [Jatrophihabitantaceae bacterium]
MSDSIEQSGLDPDRGRALAVPLERIAAAVRRERARLGMSMSELAKRAGVSKSTLSQLESGVGNPSVETLWALSTALDVEISRLLDAPRPRVAVLRRGDGVPLQSERSSYVASLLATCPPHARRDVYLVSAEPGAPRESEPHAPGTLEHVVVGAGRALIGTAEDPVELGPGDYISYPGDVRHVCNALEADTFLVWVMEHV